jgi:hypothetical protein
MLRYVLVAAPSPLSPITMYNPSIHIHTNVCRVVLEHLFAPIDKQGHLGDWRVYLATQTEPDPAAPFEAQSD